MKKINIMKVKALIEVLKEIPEETEVCIVDFVENESGIDDDESSSGIYPEFFISVMDGDLITKQSKPFVALSFKHDGLDF